MRGGGAVLARCAGPGSKNGGSIGVPHRSNGLRWTSGGYIAVPSNHTADARLYHCHLKARRLACMAVHAELSPAIHPGG